MVGAAPTERVDNGQYDVDRVGLGASMGRYELRAVVGSGGMGVVFEAHDPELDRMVAVKVLRRPGEHSDGTTGLRREGQIMARLTHLNVIRVYDVGVAHGHEFVAMEYVAGGTLHDWLQRAPRTAAEIVAVFVDAGRGLAAAHDAGLVHRDFKPANVMVGDDGRVLVTDFGVARSAGHICGEAGAAGGPESRSHGSTLTRHGEVVGTPAYMAPEQLLGGQVDARADQFSFCVSLWRALFGSAPFGGDNLEELAVSTAAGVVTPPAIADDEHVRPDLRAALERGLARDPAARFPSMHELLAVLAPRPRFPAARGDRGASAADQRSHECTGADGVRLAYATLGQGAPIVKAANWLSHLDHDWHVPMWPHWLDLLGRGNCLVRYDARGNGQSDWAPASITFEDFVADLAAVFDAAGVDRAPIVGISQGAAVAAAYAARHPDRVSALVLIGGCARGWRVKANPALTAQFEALLILMRTAWGGNNAAFRQIFTTSFFPDAHADQADWFNDLQRRTATPDNAARILSALGDIDVREELARIVAPTLVLHARGDTLMPFKDGLELAGGIAGARFVALESRNHMLLPGEPAWDRFAGELTRFVAGCADRRWRIGPG